MAALDLAGHGQSGRERRRPTVASFAEDVCAVVEAVRAPRVVLVGHSMGGDVIEVSPSCGRWASDSRATTSSPSPMRALGWSVGRIREPRGIHLMLTPVHAPILDEYLADLARSVDEARAMAGPSATRAVY